MKDNKKALEELNGKYLRALADYQNLEKQTQVWREEFVKFANQNLILEILEILDDLEKALEHVTDDGIKLVVDKIRQVLKNNGVTEVDLSGAKFDPNFCEAVEVVPGEEDGKIVKILKKGYLLGGKVIRAARVAVGKKE